MKPESSRRAFEGRLIDVAVEQWGAFEREIVRHGPSVAIVAVGDDGRVTLVRQPREPARRRLLELPAGGVDEGESPLEAARRELAEETGLRGGRWRQLAAFYTTPGFCDELMHLFVAEGVEPGPPSRRDDEDVELVRVGLDELDRLVPELEDAKTIAGLLLYLRGLAS